MLVHCAAVMRPMALDALDLETWREIQAVNVESALWLAQAFVPGMVARRFGRIIFIASDTLWHPPAGVFLPYVASKGAMMGVVWTLAVDLGPHGISVTAVAAGLTDTPASRQVNQDGQIEAVVGSQAIKRPLVPADTASTVAFLASDGAEALTGQVLVTNGGSVMR